MNLPHRVPESKTSPELIDGATYSLPQRHFRDYHRRLRLHLNPRFGYWSLLYFEPFYSQWRTAFILIGSLLARVERENSGFVFRLAGYEVADLKLVGQPEPDLDVWGDALDCVDRLEGRADG